MSHNVCHPLKNIFVASELSLSPENMPTSVLEATSTAKQLKKLSKLQNEDTIPDEEKDENLGDAGISAKRKVDLQPISCDPF